MTERPDRNLAMELVRVTEAAALAAGRWVGRGDKISADQAAVDAMRLMVDSVSMDGVVVIGEGEKDEAPMLFNGESVGNGQGSACDVAVADEEHPRAHLANGRDHLRVAFAIQDHHADLLGTDALRLGDQADVLLGRRGHVDRVRGLRPGGHLLHVDGRAGEEHRIARGEGDHGQGVRLSDGGQAGPVDRVDGDVAR